MLRDIVEQQKAEIEDLKSQIRIKDEAIQNIVGVYEFYASQVETAREIADVVDEIQAKFNDMPWYKKMFFKFEICKDQK